MLVNILNSGRIPWINKQGPLFGYELSEGAYQILARDSRVIIELTTKAEAIVKRDAYLQSLQPTKAYVKEAPKEEVVFEDSVTITAVEPAINTEANELELPFDVDNIEEVSLEEEPISEADDSALDVELDIILNSESKEEKPENERVEKVYTKEELLLMTKRQMKDILKNRGFVEGPNAGKYHDTVDMLIEKVLRTQ